VVLPESIWALIPMFRILEMSIIRISSSFYKE